MASGNLKNIATNDSTFSKENGNLVPVVNGGASLGYGLQGFKGVLLADEVTNEIYRLKINNGIITAEKI